MNHTALKSYKPKNHIRIITATSLLDGHDVAINIMRRIMQKFGVEVIHLGHNRSAGEIVDCAIQEDAHAVAITSYQGGHLEYFKFIKDLFKEKNASHIKIFGGGGGTILSSEIEELHQYGIDKIYSPDDGRSMGLEGMVIDLIKRCDYNILEKHNGLIDNNPVNSNSLAALITKAENETSQFDILIKQEKNKLHKSPILGITGTGGAGKSSVVDEIVRRFLVDFPKYKIAIISVDPSKRKSGGALLGDRIRMNAIDDPRVYMRSLATRQSNLALSRHINEVIEAVQLHNFDLIILESSGIGQSDSEIFDHSDLSVYVMTPEYGAATQLEKIDMLDFANIIAINKFDTKGAKDALKEVTKQYKRNHGLFEVQNEDIPIFGTVASRFNDGGLNDFYKKIISKLHEQYGNFQVKKSVQKSSDQQEIIPDNRIRYLSEIAENIRNYNKNSLKQGELASKISAIQTSIDILKNDSDSVVAVDVLNNQLKDLTESIDKSLLDQLQQWEKTLKKYRSDTFQFTVRNKTIEINTKTETLSGLKIPKVILPRYKNWGDLTRWLTQENVPGKFPFTAGVFPFKREKEDPTRMFAGEGGPERTNKRFHYVSQGQPAHRLSTAFDSVTLYGEDPGEKPDVYGKIGNSGVSICCLDDAKKLYSGFDLADSSTSVSMTINGPAAIMCSFFLNAAIDQQCEKYIKTHNLSGLVESLLIEKYDDKSLPRPIYSSQIPKGHNGLGTLLLGITGDEILERDVYEKIKKETLNIVRGTVQADILKEDQAQNTCIFSTEFSLRLMGDMQQYFIDQNVRNFYSVSISGYHIAEAGANSITQLAFTLANGFSYVEYYLHRGMDIDRFAPNLSFFFSNGIDPEYAVIGRVARRIWAKAMKYVYGANELSQKLKYHIQTSGRSLHSQEISFNDIRTTLQAIYAIYDNCNSLHTNAYDEAITTPTEEPVRRALAIQLIINRELGLAKNENPMQGSFIIEELTDLVEEAVMAEFDRLTERGGVLGAMERMYQRNKIQEESMLYESLKHSGEYPIIGVNTFLSTTGSETVTPGEVIRATESEKRMQIENLINFKHSKVRIAQRYLESLKKTADQNKNTFDVLMETSKHCSLGQITGALYEVGGKYRRNM